MTASFPLDIRSNHVASLKVSLLEIELKHLKNLFNVQIGVCVDNNFNDGRLVFCGGEKVLF